MLAFTTVSFLFCVLALYDVLIKRVRDTCARFRLFSALAALLCGVAGWLAGSPLLPLSAATAMLANALLLLVPGYAEPWRVLARFEIETAVLALAAALAGGFFAPVYIMGIAAIFCFVGTVFRTRRRFRRVTVLFRNMSAWKSVEDSSRLIALLLILLPALPACVAPFLDAPLSWLLSLLSCSVLCAVYVWRYLRQMKGRTLVLKQSKEEMLKDLINGNLKVRNTDDVDTRMAELYSRIQSVMDLRKPYLSDEFSMDDLAGIVLSNRTYLSRTINVMSGRGFCAFVNWYRVQYAQSLIRRNPHMRFSDMAGVCGFHSIPSFNMAFKANTGLTPSQWKQNEWGIDGLEKE